jgi:hypothetical protein
MRWVSVATDWMFESGSRALLVCVLAGLAVLWLSLDYSRLIHGFGSMKPVSLFLQNSGGAGIEFAIPLAFWIRSGSSDSVRAIFHAGRGSAVQGAGRPGFLVYRFELMARSTSI